MEPMSIREIEKAVHGVWWNPREGEEEIASVTTDSRNVPEGSLFIPIVGEKFDGHRFLDAALASGASGVLCVSFASMRPRTSAASSSGCRGTGCHAAVSGSGSGIRGKIQ